jgi:hypothetical protein
MLLVTSRHNNNHNAKREVLVVMSVIVVSCEESISSWKTILTVFDSCAKTGFEKTIGTNDSQNTQLRPTKDRHAPGICRRDDSVQSLAACYPERLHQSRRLQYLSIRSSSSSLIPALHTSLRSCSASPRQAVIPQLLLLDCFRSKIRFQFRHILRTA